MAGLTASGIGSGLDISSLISQLMTIEQQPLTALSTKGSELPGETVRLRSAQVGALNAAERGRDAHRCGKIYRHQGKRCLRCAVFCHLERLGHGRQLLGRSARAGQGTTRRHQRIDRIHAQRGRSHDHLRQGHGRVFAAGSEAAKTLSFAGGSLEEFRDAINGGELGVTASVINNGTVKQLVIKGNATGAEQAFEITGTTGLSVDPTASGVSTDPSSLASAQDAQLDVDGIVVSRSSNTVDDVIDGVTLTLNKQDVGNASTLTITDDRSGATTAINAFVSAYNNLNTTIKSPHRLQRDYSDGREPQRGFDGALDPVAIAHHAR